MSSKLKIIMPAGAFGAYGAYEGEDELTSLLRRIAVSYSSNPDEEWAEKYGTNFENADFMMHKFCWCGQDSCAWCSGEAPNFFHKPTGFRVSWYKYIGRGMEIVGEASMESLRNLIGRRQEQEEPRGRDGVE